MGEILRFKRPKSEEPMIWACDCGCVTFRLYNNGTVQCAQCNIIVPELERFFVNNFDL